MSAIAVDNFHPSGLGASARSIAEAGALSRTRQRVPLFPLCLVRKPCIVLCRCQQLPAVCFGGETIRHSTRLQRLSPPVFGGVSVRILNHNDPESTLRQVQHPNAFGVASAAIHLQGGRRKSSMARHPPLSARYRRTPAHARPLSNATFAGCREICPTTFRPPMFFLALVL